jgi:hypothetical protein
MSGQSARCFGGHSHVSSGLKDRRAPGRSRRHESAPLAAVYPENALAKRIDQVQLQSLRERLLQGPQRIEQRLPRFRRRGLECTHLAFIECESRQSEHIARSIDFQIDADPPSNGRNQQRGVLSAMAHAVSGRTHVGHRK